MPSNSPPLRPGMSPVQYPRIPRLSSSQVLTRLSSSQLLTRAPPPPTSDDDAATSMSDLSDEERDPKSMGFIPIRNVTPLAPHETQTPPGVIRHDNRFRPSSPPNKPLPPLPTQTPEQGPARPKSPKKQLTRVIRDNEGHLQKVTGGSQPKLRRFHASPNLRATDSNRMGSNSRGNQFSQSGAGSSATPPRHDARTPSKTTPARDPSTFIVPDGSEWFNVGRPDRSSGARARAWEKYRDVVGDSSDSDNEYKW